MRRLTKMKLMESKFKQQQSHVQRESGAYLGTAAAGSFFAPSKKRPKYDSTQAHSGLDTPPSEQEPGVRAEDADIVIDDGPIIRDVPFTM